MLRKGKSPNVHPMLSSMVYTGNHRPHHKEFSKEELEFILNRCGFKIIKHEYFDRKQGDYFIDKKNNTIKKHKIKKNLKNIIFELVKNTGFQIPHLRNHHILLAKKVKNIDEIIQNIKTTETLIIGIAWIITNRAPVPTHTDPNESRNIPPDESRNPLSLNKPLTNRVTYPDLNSYVIQIGSTLTL